MADTINHTWQTVEQAAVILNCSTRTIARRIAGGTIESRVDDNGRRLVLVETFGRDDSSAERQTGDVGYDLDDNALTIANASSLATPVSNDGGYSPAATSVLAVLQSTIDAARTDAARARNGARWAWAGVAGMAVVIGVAGMLITGRLTRAETQVDMLQSDVADAKIDLVRSRNDLLIVSSAKAVADQKREAAEQQLTAAAMKQAATETLLASVKQEETKIVAVTQKAEKRGEKSPATQPMTLFGRLVNLPIEADGR